MFDGCDYYESNLQDLKYSYLYFHLPEFIGFDEKIFTSRSWQTVTRALIAAEKGTFQLQEDSNLTPVQALQLVIRSL